jgi:protein-S-isoprenylcysteine O-methyltransferase Ste14
MKRFWAILGSLAFLVLAPGIVAGLVPWWLSGWQVQPPLFGLMAVRFAGLALIALGTPALLDSFARFALQGLGTPAPIFPTQHLVVTGLYRYVRNPMYVGVVAMIVGQGLFLGNLHVLEYATVPWLVAHLFVVGYEEPTLRRTFGEEYERFCANVPRWIPRLRPLQGE